MNRTGLDKASQIDFFMILRLNWGAHSDVARTDGPEKTPQKMAKNWGENLIKQNFHRNEPYKHYKLRESSGMDKKFKFKIKG